MDTNIVSQLIKNNKIIQMRYDIEVGDEDSVLGCPIVWYEARRGLLANDSKGQMQRLIILFGEFDWEDYSRADWELAAQLWAQRKVSGRPIHDADLLIAVFAMNRNAVLVTDNEKDFDGLGVTVENWKQT